MVCSVAARLRQPVSRGLRRRAAQRVWCRVSDNFGVAAGCSGIGDPAVLGRILIVTASGYRAVDRAGFQGQELASRIVVLVVGSYTGAEPMTPNIELEQTCSSQ